MRTVNVETLMDSHLDTSFFGRYILTASVLMYTGFPSNSSFSERIET